MSAAKKSRTAPLPEDVQVGCVVFFSRGASGEDSRGIVSDAWPSLDQYWVKDSETGEVVRDEDGNITVFSCEELRFALLPGAAEPAEHAEDGKPKQSGRVLIVGTEEQMLRILKQFGQPDISMRRDPQMLLAVPCSECVCGPNCTRFDPLSENTCDPETCPLLQVLEGGVVPGLRDLAVSMRPDRVGNIGVRPYHIKQALEQMGPDLAKLEGCYVLASVTVPFGIQDIEAAPRGEQREMEEVHNQIDVGVSACGPSDSEDGSLEKTARRVLGEAIGVTVTDKLWEDEVQLKLRRHLDVDIPFKYWDGPDSKGLVLILPADLSIDDRTGILAFREPGAAGTKTQDEWEASQDQFGAEPKLPEGWIRVKSRNGGNVYYWNTKTKTSTFEVPLPDGWTKQVSKSTGKTYYFNSKRKTSSYKVPAE